MPVGNTKVANLFGLYDTHGNVAEWCLDAWHDSYDGAPTDGGAWVSGAPAFRVARGGSWNSIGAFCVSAFRMKAGGAGKSNEIGFRVVLANASTR